MVWTPNDGAEERRRDMQRRDADVLQRQDWWQNRWQVLMLFAIGTAGSFAVTWVVMTYPWLWSWVNPKLLLALMAFGLLAATASASRLPRQAIKFGFRKYVNFSGRAAQSEYWYFPLFLFVVGLASFDSRLGGFSGGAMVPAQHSIQLGDTPALYHDVGSAIARHRHGGPVGFDCILGGGHSPPNLVGVPERRFGG